MQKGLLLFNAKLSNRVHFEQKDRGSKFYNKYEWCISWVQSEINVLRNSLDDRKVEEAIQNARYWEKQKYESEWSFYNKKPAFKSRITDRAIDDIHTVRRMLKDGPPNKRILSFGSIMVYTDDAEFKDKLVDYGKTQGFVVVRRANIVYPKDAVALIDPKYKYRTYLKSKRVSEESISALKNWVDAQGEELRISPGLKDFFNRKDTRWYYSREWTADYHFFDHNDLRYETMLRMVLPVAIRKTVPIIAK